MAGKSSGPHRWAEDDLYIPTPRNPIADAYTGPTPEQSFILHTRLDEERLDKFYVMFEINQTWDWNEYWTNNKYPDDEEYKTSCQPAVVYSVLIDLNDPQEEYEMRIIGRSHESGANGELYDDINEKIYINAEYEWAYMSNTYYLDGFVNSAMGGIGMRF